MVPHGEVVATRIWLITLFIATKTADGVGSQVLTKMPRQVISMIGIQKPVNVIKNNLFSQATWRHHDYCFYSVASFLFLAEGNWGSWETWQDCSKTCGSGFRLRTRQCNDQSTLNEEEEVEGTSIERETCNDFPCTTTSAAGRTEQISNYCIDIKQYMKKISSFF